MVCAVLVASVLEPAIATRDDDLPKTKGTGTSLSRPKQEPSPWITQSVMVLTHLKKTI